MPLQTIFDQLSNWWLSRVVKIFDWIPVSIIIFCSASQLSMNVAGDRGPHCTAPVPSASPGHQTWDPPALALVPLSTSDMGTHPTLASPSRHQTWDPPPPPIVSCSMMWWHLKQNPSIANKYFFVIYFTNYLTKLHIFTCLLFYLLYIL